MVPTLTGKLGKMAFPVEEKSGNFEQIAKIGENQTKYWKKSGNFRQMLFIFFSNV